MGGREERCYSFQLNKSINTEKVRINFCQGWGWSSVVKPGMQKALGSIPSTSSKAKCLFPDVIN
jgi:hypothetical protein